jgi:hypothetical protein
MTVNRLATLAFVRGLAATALIVHLQDRRVVHKPLNGRQRHGLVGEDLTPFTERLVGGDQQGSAFVTGGDELEQHTGLSLILGDVGDVVQVHAAEIPDRSRVGGGTFAFFLPKFLAVSMTTHGVAWIWPGSRCSACLRVSGWISIHINATCVCLGRRGRAVPKCSKRLY